jgi:hypothetical protein
MRFAFEPKKSERLRANPRRGIGFEDYGVLRSRKKNYMKTIAKKPRKLAADEIADLADDDQDISRFFTGTGRMVAPAVKRVNVDFAEPMLDELDRAATELNISRQAVIKTLVRQALDQRHLAAQAEQQQRKNKAH